MTRKDWCTTGVVAAVVAAVTGALVAPPMLMAEGIPKLTVPGLPSTSLYIPAAEAQVSAKTVPSAPGEPVVVALTATLPLGTEVTEVPVAITVTRTDFDTMSRVGPRPQTIATVTATVPVTSEGKGTANVELPLNWDAPAAPVQQNATRASGRGGRQQIAIDSGTRYAMALSSTLGNAAAAPETIGLNAINVNQVQGVDTAFIAQNQISRQMDFANVRSVAQMANFPIIDLADDSPVTQTRRR